ncbi:MAG: WavE lipopolysaccharide synthesis family protein [Janthinobacterium lividum]
MICDKDISIVVQGPVLGQAIFGMTDNITKVVCARLKELFPESELILSTWKGAKTKDICYDKLILSKDPGGVWFDLEDLNFTNNCNRLIVSTQAGIKAATRKYILKVRSDLFVMSKSFLKYFYKFSHYDEPCKFVKNRIIAFSLDTIKGHRTSLFTQQRPYHISDWAYFGYAEDIKDLYDVPLTKEPEFSQYFLDRPKHFFDIHPARLWKMPPEQYITLSFLQKHTDIKFEHMSDIAHQNIERSEKLLVNNFLVLDQTQFFLFSLKYAKLQLLFPYLLSKTAIFFHTWLQDYDKYCVLSCEHKIKIFWRKNCFAAANMILNLLNYRFGLVQRIVCFRVKRWINEFNQKNKN